MLNGPREPEIMRKIAVVAVLALLVTACSGVKIFYNLIDDIIWEAVEFHLNLEDDEEKAFTRQKVRELMDWHRTAMLPVYARHFLELATILEKGEVTRARLRAAFKEGRGLIEATVRGALPYVATILVRHRGTAKRTYFRDRMKERLNERLEEEKQPRKERLEKRIERIVDNFERFTGDLNDAQIAIIGKHANRSIDDMTTRLTNKRLRQKAFIEFLATGPSEKALTTYLDTLLIRPWEIEQPDYKAFSDGAITRFREMLFKIVRSMTAAQRKRTAATLRSYADDFVDLSS